ncbi:methylated-DNA--protein-cysteine methyltransferase isoform X2 [Heterodontus francisci]|uniref:methylated-DNA--protein-cysteine methyltransferase isoform X2 n=1 Tax=Heterodontus francisci TaxID=7792 RepID=UPI00355BCD2E
MANMAARLHQKVTKNNTSHCKQVTAALQSPIGTIQVSGCEEGIHSIQLQEDFAPEDRTRVASFTSVVCESQEEMTAPVKYCMTWLQAYFSEPWTTEKLPLPAFHHPIFQQAGCCKLLNCPLGTDQQGDNVNSILVISFVDLTQLHIFSGSFHLLCNYNVLQYLGLDNPVNVLLNVRWSLPCSAL